MADWSLDNQISNRLFKTDNDLAPFYRSVSCWALIGIWILDISATIRKYPHWQVAGQLFLLWLLLVTATAALGVLFYLRRRLANYLKNQPAKSPVPLEPLRFLSAGMVKLAGALLLVVLFVIVGLR
jgi:hypothetical protein